MAMTKKEQAAFDALAYQLKLLKSFRWSDKVDADVPPGIHDSINCGWLTRGTEYPRVEKAWSTERSHGFGTHDVAEIMTQLERGTSRQGTRWLYSSEEMALRALRFDVCELAAHRLLSIDEAIEKADRK